MEHQNRHAIFTTSNCDIRIQQGLESSDIIMGAPELHGGGVDDVMKAAGGSLPEGEGCLYRIRKPPDTLTSVD